LSVRVNNVASTGPAAYIETNGTSYGLKVSHTGTTSTANALLCESTNTGDSSLGVTGYELGRGTVKVTHNKPAGAAANDANASCVSVNAVGAGTAAQLFYGDSTDGTTGRLLTLRNQTLDKFCVGPDGATFIANVSAQPNTIAGGATAFVESGVLKVKSSTGFVATLTNDLKLSSGVVGGGRVVRFTDATHVAIASADTAAHASMIAGVSKTAASGSEQTIEIVRTGGEVDDSGWTWTAGLPVYCGINGVLTQTYSAAWSFVLIVGVALSATRIAVQLRDPISQG
jgi:hypothetical protein